MKVKNKRKFIGYFLHPIVTKNTKPRQCLRSLYITCFLSRHFYCFVRGPVVLLPTPMTSIKNWGNMLDKLMFGGRWLHW